MSFSWWTWYADVGAAIKELQKVESEKDTLLKRVEVLESRTESLMANVEWLMKKLDQEDNKPTELPTPPTSTSIALALHGGFAGPQPLRQPTPLPPPPPQLVHPAPPTEEHATALHNCMQNRWHSSHFNAWLVHSQTNSGDEFVAGDHNYAICQYVQRLQTFTLPVSLIYEGKSKMAASVLQKAIEARVTQGAKLHMPQDEAEHLQRLHNDRMFEVRCKLES